MSNNGDESRYMEGNYSQIPYVRTKQYLDDAQQAHDLAVIEEYMRAWLAWLKKMEDEHHYLVDGAILRCTNCTSKPQEYNGQEFIVPENSDVSALKVTKNSKYLNDVGQCFATVEDTERNVNIFPFGNCKNPPDREKEEHALLLASQSEELRNLGTCIYLMDLNSTWDNLVKDDGYEKIGGIDTVTKESILFCKHGGFIYPISSGYIPTDTELEEEGEDELVREEIMIAPWLRAYKGLPTREGGIKINDLKIKERNELKEKNKKNSVDGKSHVDWYSYMSGINSNVADQYKDAGKEDEYNPVFDENHAYVNNVQDYRYWVAVGPEILCPGYNQMYSEEEQTISASQFNYGTEIDVVLRNTTNDEVVYIECIVGEVKGHTYPHGVFQTGEKYPYSTNKDDDSTPDGSYIEFLAKQSDNGTMSDYVVTEIIVYERKWYDK